MKTVENIHIRTIIKFLVALHEPDGLIEIKDVVWYNGLKDRDELSPYYYFSRYFRKSRKSKFKYKMIGEYDEGEYFDAQFGSYTNRKGEWETFWAAFLILLRI